MPRSYWRAADFPAPDPYTIPIPPALGPQHIAAWREELLEGRGFLLLRGLAATNIEQAQQRYQELAARLGEPIAQKARGDLLYAVRDEGYRLERDYGAVGVRFSKTAEALDFHTDSALEVRGRIPDVVGLLAWRVARSGGESALVSARTAYDVLHRERPELAERLCRPLPIDRRVEVGPGEPAVLHAPVFSENAGLRVRYFRYYIERSVEVTGQPVHPADIEALDAFDEICRRPALQVRFAMQPGDVQFVNNTFILHSRTAFEDWPEPEQRRHLVRLWLDCGGPKPLSAPR